MQWTAARRRYLAFLAPSLAGRVNLVTAVYRDESCTDPGRGTIVVDGVEIAAFESIRYWRMMNREAAARHRARPGVPYDTLHAEIRAELLAAGIADYADFTRAVRAYPELPLADALASPDPALRSLALLDRRLGKHRLATLLGAPDPVGYVRRLAELRAAAEGVDAEGRMARFVALVERAGDGARATGRPTADGTSAAHRRREGR